MTSAAQASVLFLGGFHTPSSGTRIARGRGYGDDDAGAGGQEVADPSAGTANHEHVRGIVRQRIMTNLETQGPYITCPQRTETVAAPPVFFRQRSFDRGKPSQIEREAGIGPPVPHEGGRVYRAVGPEMLRMKPLVKLIIVFDRDLSQALSPAALRMRYSASVRRIALRASSGETASRSL